MNLKKRKASDSIIITGNTQIVPPAPQLISPQSIVSLPITITRKKEEIQQVPELISIKLEPFEELLSSNTQLRSSADITVKEITDWAKTFKIPQAAVNELLQILKIKRVKLENSDSRPPEANVLQQSKKHLFYLKKLKIKKKFMLHVKIKVIHPKLKYLEFLLINF